MLIGLASPALAQPNRIASRIDNSRTVLVGGRATRLANSSHDAGRVESGFPGSQRGEEPVHALPAW